MAKTAVPKTRILRPPQYKALRLSKRIKHPGVIPGAPRLFWRALTHLRQSWKLYGLILLTYLLLTLVLVKGFTATTNLGSLKQSLHSLFGSGSLNTGFTLFGILLGSSSSGSGDVGATYQTFLLVVMSLVFIWAIRQRYAEHKVTARDSFYQSMYPLIPFLIIILVITLQLIPLIIGNLLYNTVMGNGLAVSGLEKFTWGALYFLLALLSFYLLTSSLFALYIVTLPDVRPMQALRSARKLVRYRRWTVLRKILFLPLILIVLALAIMLPVIVWWTPAAEWIFLVLTLISLPITHAYMYGLYRELL